MKNYLKIQIILAILLLFIGLSSIAQVTTGLNTSITNTDYVGWANSVTFDLNINHKGNYNINFLTNGSQKMMINAGGNVSINNTNNTYKLDVSGDINIASTQVYRIGTNHVLSNAGTNNLFVGVGSNTSWSSATDNTHIGYNAGTAITTGGNNTIIGSQAGVTISTAGNNSFFGYKAGNLNTSGTYNSFYGVQAGQLNQTSDNNSFFGHDAGQNATAGSNSFFGSNCGNGNTAGTNNTFIGFNCGFSLTQGDYNLLEGTNAGRDLSTSNSNDNNVILGAQAGYTASPVITTGTALTLVGYNAETNNSRTNASAIGSNAYVTSDNSLVLGSIASTNGAGASANTNIGIGTTAPTSRLHVLNNVENITGYFDCTNAGMTDIIKAVYNQTSTGSIDGIEVSLTNSSGVNNGNINGVNVNLTTTSTIASLINTGYRTLITSSTTDNTQTNYGIYSAVDAGTHTKINHGIYAEAGSSTDQTGSTNYGGKFYAFKGAAYTPKVNYGVWGKGHQAITNYGGYFLCDGDAQAGTNYAVYGEAGGSNNYYAAYFNGIGVLTSTTWQTSDVNLKENITPLTNNLQILSQLNPRSFTFRHADYPSMVLPEGIHYGLIAQEVEPILPQLVKNIVHPADFDDSTGVLITASFNYKAMNYTELIPFFIGAIQEQQQQIEDLNNRLTSCCGPGIVEFQIPDNGTNQPSTINHQELVSVARDLPVLSQNQPNPFSEKTLIRFYIPKTTKDAAIKVFDNTGSVYRLFALTGEGPGTIEIEANTLTSGNYYYSLLIGGNVIDTKTLVITK